MVKELLQLIVRCEDDKQVQERASYKKNFVSAYTHKTLLEMVFPSENSVCGKYVVVLFSHHVTCLSSD